MNFQAISPQVVIQVFQDNDVRVYKVLNVSEELASGG